MHGIIINTGITVYMPKGATYQWWKLDLIRHFYIMVRFC